jgi:hypothetical protein
MTPPMNMTLVPRPVVSQVKLTLVLTLMTRIPRLTIELTQHLLLSLRLLAMLALMISLPPQTGPVADVSEKVHRISMQLGCPGFAVLECVSDPLLAVLNIRFPPVVGARIDPSMISEQGLQLQAGVE